LTYGLSSGASPVLSNLNNALYRMSAIGAISLLVPGPKMIWHFASLGMSDSIYTCSNGTVNTETDATTGDCKLSTKPQPQWVNNWLANTQRNKIYNDWAKMIELKKNNLVFSSNYAISPNGTNLKQRIYIWNDALPSTQLKNVVVLANFNTDSTTITPDFPYTGTWINLMDNSTISVTSTTSPITIEAGGYRIYGNAAPALSSQNIDNLEKQMVLYPNPTSNNFNLNTNTSQVEIYTITGQLVKTFDKQNSNYNYSISELNNGIYLVKVVDENNYQQTIKIIKE
jgi:hypothetical protein